MKTFKQWLDSHFSEIPDIEGELIEDGYAWYLEQKLGRVPTIAEMKSIGKINLLCSGL